jgi:hypothetical protein
VEPQSTETGHVDITQYELNDLVEHMGAYPAAKTIGITTDETGAHATFYDGRAQLGVAHLRRS